ncbi:hypothetical protein HGRIS_001983 [Hohenbuehelia grisea]|uniref:Uncharacterized protein n=1 Tax=Hohenbuehelia grisea TaxID=104357 RepID=A0ABR3JK39_9AGAR
MKQVFSLGIIAASLVAAEKANDWSEACFHGECAYDLAGTEAAGYGSVKLSGSPKSITDITTAAGWVVLDCDPHAMAQEIRLVCKSEETEGCGHLFEHGAVNKVVRLPEACGSGPFARISNVRPANDQSIPAHAEAKIARRDNLAPQVYLLNVDTNWAAIDYAKMGDVNFALVAANHPDLIDANNFATHFGIPKGIGSTLLGAGKSLLGKLTEVKLNGEKSLSKTWPLSEKLLDAQKTCDRGSATISADISGSVIARAYVGVTIVGQLPAKIDKKKSSVYAGFSGDFEATLALKANLNGQTQKDKIIVQKTPMEKFGTSGLVEVMPSFELSAHTEAKLDINVDASIPLKFKIGAEYSYPKNKVRDASKDTFTPKAAHLKIEANGEVAGNGLIEGHLQSTVKIDISALGGSIKSNMRIGADAWAKLTLDSKGQGAASASVKAKPKKGKRAYPPPSGLHARELVPRAPPVTVKSKTSGSKSFEGCVEFTAGLLVTGGIEDSQLFGAPDTDRVDKKYLLLKKCYPSSGNARRSLPEPSWLVARSELAPFQDALKCSTVTGPNGIVEDQDISASAAKAI